jgi:hypothetical protein
VDPCGDAYALGLDYGDLGGVVCCGGKKYSCAWTQNYSGSNYTNPAAIEILSECTKKHEDGHHDDVVCPNGKCDDTVTRAKNKPGTDDETEEQKSYKVSCQCLLRSKKKCKGNRQCMQQIDQRVSYVCKRAY